MHGDGNGWVRCGQGHRHWGIHGAAGLLVWRDRLGGNASVLMQHRAAWTSDGDTWGIPGGARDSHETPVQAALREAAEEAGIESTAITVVADLVDDHGGWAYVTVVAQAIRPLAIVANAESAELRWVPEVQVDALALHPGFARSWPTVRGLRGGRSDSAALCGEG
jgi:8-oxo-dGTP diphosphatase